MRGNGRWPRANPPQGAIAMAGGDERANEPRRGYLQSMSALDDGG
jgi:hypothetical protein